MQKPIYKNAYYSFGKISKKSIIASFYEGSVTRNWLESLNLDNWNVVSFVPNEKIVHIDVFNQNGRFIHVALTIPIIN